MSLRTYHDPLHGAIRLDHDDDADALAIDLIDTAPFQRLRRIRQLGTASLTFQGAESSRFTHSLGVLHIARQALAHLRRQAPGLAAHRLCLQAAARSSAVTTPGASWGCETPPPGRSCAPSSARGPLPR